MSSKNRGRWCDSSDAVHGGAVGRRSTGSRRSAATLWKTMGERAHGALSCVSRYAFDIDYFVAAVEVVT